MPTVTNARRVESAKEERTQLAEGVAEAVDFLTQIQKTKTQILPAMKFSKLVHMTLLA
jgi:hypothetical protein